MDVLPRTPRPQAFSRFHKIRDRDRLGFLRFEIGVFGLIQNRSAALVLALVSIEVAKQVASKTMETVTHPSRMIGTHRSPVVTSSGNHAGADQYAPFTKDHHAPEAGQPTASSGV
ncbi:hypothetical protein [Azotobacter vinelandii]|uniref:hypothetical protein n=1 Tax=Azotobacter vinelandii TaxID=354 RepID=UPI0026656EE9|nr:hypothetical protein [Azotobacter vinelandii]WKN20623.1 hypothetical protein AVAEIV_003627 [Azotobacter vinelandii]